MTRRDSTPETGEHHCGPTVEQVNDAHMRGETLGTWPRCDDCAKREDELLARIPFVKRSEMPSPDFRRIVP